MTNGKGDSDRVRNHRKFRENFESIFGRAPTEAESEEHAEEIESIMKKLREDPSFNGGSQ